VLKLGGDLGVLKTQFPPSLLGHEIVEIYLRGVRMDRSIYLELITAALSLLFKKRGKGIAKICLTWNLNNFAL